MQPAMKKLNMHQIVVALYAIFSLSSCVATQRTGYSNQQQACQPGRPQGPYLQRQNDDHRIQNGSVAQQGTDQEISWEAKAGKSPNDPELLKIRTYVDANGKFHRNEYGLLTENVLRGIFGRQEGGQFKGAAIGWNANKQCFGIEGGYAKETIPLQLVVNSCFLQNIFPPTKNSPTQPDLREMVRQKWIKERGYDPQNAGPASHGPNRRPSPAQGNQPLLPPAPQPTKTPGNPPDLFDTDNPVA